MTSGPSKRSNFTVRLCTAALLVPLAVGAIVAGGVIFTAFVAIVGSAAAFEFARLVEGRGLGPGAWPMMLAGAGAAAAMLLADATAALAVVALALAAALGLALRDRDRAGGLVAGVVYVGLAVPALVALRGADRTGLVAVLFVFAVVWATDIGAYVVGRTVGGPKLAPAISPGKTRSGAVGGLAAGVAAGLAVIQVASPPVGWEVVAVAALISVASQSGDLYESALKRRAGVKDSGRLIPGHGGVLDRIDGLVFGVIAGFAVGAFRAGLAAPGRGLVAW